MIAKVKDIFRRDSFRATFASGVATLIRTLTAFVTNKIIAVYIGPGGIGLVGQLLNLIAILLPVSTGGINNGITKYVAEYNEHNKDDLKSLIGTSFRITVLISSILGALIIVFSETLSVYIFHSVIYRNIIIVLGVSLIFYALNSVLLSIVNGLKEFKLYNSINILTSITGFVFTVVLSLIFKVKGALLAAVTFQSVTFIVTVIMLKKREWLSLRFIREPISAIQVKKLLAFSIMSIVGAFAIPTAQILIRSYLIGKLSLDQAGYWESVNRISNLYLSLITTSLATYYLPKLSELQHKPKELASEIISGFKLFIPLIFALTFIIYLSRDLIITIVFTDKFSPMRDLFLFQLIGDIFKISTWLLALLMVAKAQTARFIIVEFFFASLYYLLTIILVPRFSLMGATYAFALSYACCFLLVLYFFRNLIFLKHE